MWEPGAAQWLESALSWALILALSWANHERGKELHRVEREVDQLRRSVGDERRGADRDQQ